MQTAHGVHSLKDKIFSTHVLMAVFKKMFHHGPSDNDSRVENFNNKHLLRDDFGTSVNGLHTVESHISLVMSKDNGFRNDCTIISQVRSKL